MDKLGRNVINELRNGKSSEEIVNMTAYPGRPVDEAIALLHYLQILQKSPILDALEEEENI